MYSLVDFNTQIECHASKNNRFDHWEHRSINLHVVKVKFVIVLYVVLR